LRLISLACRTKCALKQFTARYQHCSC